MTRRLESAIANARRTQIPPGRRLFRQPPIIEGRRPTLLSRRGFLYEPFDDVGCPDRCGAWSSLPPTVERTDCVLGTGDSSFPRSQTERAGGRLSFHRLSSGTIESELAVCHNLSLAVPPAPHITCPAGLQNRVGLFVVVVVLRRIPCRQVLACIENTGDGHPPSILGMHQRAPFGHVIKGY